MELELQARRATAARPYVAAHRGAWRGAPQNSLPALEQAIALGCEMVELDVRGTRDGRLAVVHDARVRGVPVAAQDLDELQARLEHVPRLEEMVELASGRIALDVELKDGNVAPALAVLGRQLEPEAYVVTSFLDQVVAEASAQAQPGVRTGLLLRPGRPPRRLEARLAATGAAFLALPGALARAGLLAWAANRGLASVVWTINEQRALRSLLADERVAAVITDRPELALELRGSPV